MAKKPNQKAEEKNLQLLKEEADRQQKIKEAEELLKTERQAELKKAEEKFNSFLDEWKKEFGVELEVEFHGFGNRCKSTLKIVDVKK